MAQIPLIAIGRIPAVKRRSVLGNIVFWVGLFAGESSASSTAPVGQPTAHQVSLFSALHIAHTKGPELGLMGGMIA
jgi:hypothetical protein